MPVMIIDESRGRFAHRKGCNFCCLAQFAVGLSFGRFQLFLNSARLVKRETLASASVCVRVQYVQCGLDTETRSKLTPTAGLGPRCSYANQFSVTSNK